MAAGAGGSSTPASSLQAPLREEPGFDCEANDCPGEGGLPRGPPGTGSGPTRPGRRGSAAVVALACGAAVACGLLLLGPPRRSWGSGAVLGRDDIRWIGQSLSAFVLPPVGSSRFVTEKRAGPRSIVMQDQTSASVVGRRDALKGFAAAAAAAAIGLPQTAAAEDEPVKVYFGAGCFWHVQHEFVGEEVKGLKRTKDQITAVSGYAGGKQTGGGKVCYHNAFFQADYGQLGHSEVVQVEIPRQELPRFAEKYFSIFGTRGIRHDPQDRGGEYRSALGLPGGTSSPLYKVIQQAAADSPGGMKLVAGTGNEPDTIAQKAVLVYDSNEFPFYPAEVYHQFHNDFMGPAYGKAYNNLQSLALEKGMIAKTGCPEMDLR
mmetsp:Transcript_84747/g.240380  ORF Transcript_84747/g.240380 Transcript_84747/m.240380 type:complete len:375 (+) Transcript_84747:80-1204(+)